MSCLYGIEQDCDECRMCNREEEQAGTETAKERKDDLISRSAVIELIESKFVDGCLEKGDESLIDGYGLLDEVFELPTAMPVEQLEELKKCPFCGDKAITFHIPQNDEKEMKQHPKWKWNHPGMWVIGCNTGMCMGNINHFSMVFVDERSAIETWNRRCR